MKCSGLDRVDHLFGAAMDLRELEVKSGTKEMMQPCLFYLPCHLFDAHLRELEDLVDRLGACGHVLAYSCSRDCP